MIEEIQHLGEPGDKWFRYHHLYFLVRNRAVGEVKNFASPIALSYYSDIVYNHESKIVLKDRYGPSKVRARMWGLHRYRAIER